MNTATQTHTGINSLFSLQPLVAVLKRMVAEGKPGSRKLYEDLLQEIDAQPQILQPTEDLQQLQTATGLVDSILATIFPPATTNEDGLYAIAYPFSSEIIYASAPFQALFMTDGDNRISMAGAEFSESITQAFTQLAYNLVLRKFYHQPVAAVASSVHALPDAGTGLVRYIELKLDAGFVAVKPADAQFALPKNIPVQQALDIEALQNTLPLDRFCFEGLIVINVADVTGTQIISEIKNKLLTLNISTGIAMYADLQPQVQTLLGLPGVDTGVTPFFRKNDYSLFSDAYFSNSIILRRGDAADHAARFSRLSAQMFRTNEQPLLYNTLTTENVRNALVQAYYDIGARSLLICPLKCDDGKLIGLLEIMSTQEGAIRFEHVTRLQPAIPLFALALEKYAENLELQIDKTIKEHFTAIQPAVEWKFTEAAFNYLQNQQREESVKMRPIAFEQVYPLYGAIDVRNSSLERNNAIQLDLMEQLTAAGAMLDKAAKGMAFPLLREMQFKIDQFLTTASDALLSDDELLICDFLQQEVHSLFRHLHSTRPELQKAIDEYFGMLDADRNMVYHHRKDYEESITRINDVLDRFIDGEQKVAQQVYPHYFERYITDGIEFNIYVGQSLAPEQPFDEIYVRNMKLWQLTVLARAARLSHALEKRLSLPLQTTQLILAHSIPLSISFRRKERKFDVDGAYNIRYEIIKKRIDKVHLKDSEERLTQPGKVAIVYSQQKELNEYLEYVAFLQSEGLLTGNIEHLELEDTQGINGLKAIRVAVQYAAEVAVIDKESAAHKTTPVLQQ